MLIVFLINYVFLMSVSWHWFLDPLLTPLFLEVPEAPTAAETIGNDAPLACASLGATVSATLGDV